jgi:glycosyltransferase involved in cell wall biosynthesis
MNVKKNTIIIITDSFPFGEAEPLLKIELSFLLKKYTEVLFIPSNFCVSDLNNYSETKFINLKIKKSFFLKFFIFLNPIEIFSEFRSSKLNLSFRNLFGVIRTMHYYNSNEYIFRKKLIKEIKKRKLNFSELTIYTYWFTYCTYSIYKLKSYHPELKIYSRIHGFDLYKERHPIQYLPFREKIINKLNGLFPISQQGIDYLYKNYNLSKNKNIHLSYLGTQRGRLNSHISKDGKLRIISIAYVSKVKNIELLLEALSLLDIEFEWTHIGDGNEIYFNEIIEQAYLRLNKKKGTFNFLGNLSQEQIHHFLSSQIIDVFINTSHSEGIPISMMEALSYGVPIIGPNVGGIPELLDDSVGILLKKQPTAIEIAQAITEFEILHEEIKLEYRINCINKWERKFNSDKNLKHFVNNLLEL